MEYQCRTKIALSNEQKRALYADGLVVCENVLSAEQLAAARREIWRSIGRLSNAASGLRADPIRRVRNSTRGDGLEGGEEAVDAAVSDIISSSPAILDLFGGSPLVELVQDLMAPSGTPIRRPGFGQIAVNFPASPPTGFVGQPGFPDDEVLWKIQYFK